jgi:hypothetical protein
MPLYLVSTVRRRCPPDQPSGYIYVVDPVKGQVMQRSSIVEPLYRDLDANPRGGMRGAKGIAVRPDQIALANFSKIIRFDPQWNVLGEISHPSCAGIHDILFEGERLWVAAARVDMLVQFDLSGELQRFLYMREPSPALEAIPWKPPLLLTPEHIRSGKIDFRHPQQHVKEDFDRAHVNSVCLLRDGSKLASLGFVFDDKFAALLRLKIRLIQWGVWPAFKAVNRLARGALGKKQKNMDQNLVVKPAKARSALVRIAPDGKRSLCLGLENITAPSHSLLALPDDTVVYLNTTDGSILHVEPYTGKLLSNTRVAVDGFLRGVTTLATGAASPQTLLVGSRGEIITFDLPECLVLERMKITEDPNEAVYDIKELPAHYEMPPVSFAERYAEKSG